MLCCAVRSYYLGYAYFDMYNKADAKDEEAMANLKTAVDFFTRRLNIQQGNEEELWCVFHVRPVCIYIMV